MNSIIWLRNLSKYRKSGIDREWMKNLENVGENRLEPVECFKIIYISRIISIRQRKLKTPHTKLDAVGPIMKKA